MRGPRMPRLARLATLSRRLAQDLVLVERAAELLPRDPEGRHDGPQHLEAGVALAPFDAGVIGAIDLGDFGEALLRE